MTTLYYCAYILTLSRARAADVESLLGRLIPKLNYTPSAITSRVKLFTAFSSRCCASNSLQMKTILFRHGLPSCRVVKMPFNESRIIPFIYHRRPSRNYLGSRTVFAPRLPLPLPYSLYLISLSRALPPFYACTNLNLRRLTRRVRPPRSLSCRALHREIVSRPSR